MIRSLVSRRASRALVSAALLGGSWGCREPVGPGQDRDAGWLSDLSFLDAPVVSMHPETPGDPGFAGFRDAVRTLAAEVSSLTDEEIGAGIQKILVAVGDGHTTLIPDDVGPLAFLALTVDFYWFDDGVHVVSVRPGLGDVVGARVVAVAGVPVDDVVSRIMPFVPRDNAQSGRWLGAQLMQYASVRELTHELKTLGAHIVNGERNRQLTGKRAVTDMLQAYETLRDGDSKLPATWNIIRASACKPASDH